MWKFLQGKYDNLAASFYDWGSSWAGKLSSLFRLDKFSSWLTRHLKRPLSIVSVELFVGLSLAICYFFLTLYASSGKPDPMFLDSSFFNTQMFTYLSHNPVENTKDFLDPWPEWKTRLPGPMITGWMTDQATEYCARRNFDPEACSFGIGAWRYSVFKCTFGFYHAAWLFALFCLLIYYRNDALLVMLGTFAGLMISVSIVGQRTFTPFDMPAMFFFTWAVITYDHSRRMLPLAAVVCLGALFRETTMLCAFLILLGEYWPLRKRIIGFVSTVAVYLAIKKLLIFAYAVPVATFSLVNFFSRSHLLYNFDLIFIRHELNSPIFANADALLILVVLPWRTYRDKLFKLIAGMYVVSMLFFGVVTEFRIWYELLPLGWIMLSEFMSNRYPAVVKSQIAPTQQLCSVSDVGTSRAMKGSYCLIITILVVMATVGFIVAAEFVTISLGPQMPENVSDEQAILNHQHFTEGAKSLADMNNLAWALATSPETNIRNGTLAIELAERDCEQTQYGVTAFVGTLGAAYAEAGRFDDAILTAQRACGLATLTGNQRLLKRNQELIELYRKHQPYHEAAAKPADPFYR